MALAAASVAALVGAALLLVLAGWLLALQFQSRVHRAFALVLVLFASRTTFRQLARAAQDQGPWHEIWRHMDSYVTVGLLPALVWFLLAYLPARRRAWQPWAALCLGVAGIGGVLWTMAEPCAFLCDTGEGRRYGPLASVLPLTTIGYGATALLLAHRSVLRPDDPRRRAEVLVSVACTIQALFESVGPSVLLFEPGIRTLTAGASPHAWAMTVWLLPLVAIPLSGAAIAFQHRSSWRKRRRHVIRNGYVVYTAIVASTIWANLSSQDSDWVRVVGGAWLIGFGALVAYALVRHRLFDSSARLRLTFARGIVAALFVAIFFAVTEGAQNYFITKTQSNVLGVLSASLLVFFIAPLQQVAERITRGVVPADVPVDAMTQRQKQRLYRDQVLLVWADGVMGRKERQILDHLRENLGLGYGIAARIEHEALATDPPLPRAAPETAGKTA